MLSLLKIKGNAEVAKVLDGRGSRNRLVHFSIHKLVRQTLRLLDHAIQVDNAKVLI